MASIGGQMLISLLMGYAMGSIPFGLLLAKISGAGDIRNIGSGNIGATNVLRTGNKPIAALTLLLDVAKGAVPVLLAMRFLPGTESLAAAGAFFGHLYPVWLKFNGGKGVATYAGIMFGLCSWEGGLIYAAVWIGALMLLRISSAAGLLAAIAAPLVAAWMGNYDIIALLVACSLLVFWNHRANIERLLAGTEPRVGSKAS
ncbi:MAG: glycerol-3-phosphate 1-O-acyltransferase PlsY [Sphingorhabdus sp.]